MIVNILSIVLLVIACGFSEIQNARFDNILASCTKDNLESCVLSNQNKFLPLTIKHHNLTHYFMKKVVVQNPEMKMVITNATLTGVEGVELLGYKYNGTHIIMKASYSREKLHAHGNCDVNGKLSTISINGIGEIDVIITGIKAVINFKLAKIKSQVKVQQITANYDVKHLQTQLINVFKSKDIERSLNKVLIENWQVTNELFREEGTKLVIRISNIYNNDILQSLPSEIFH